MKISIIFVFILSVAVGIFALNAIDSQVKEIVQEKSSKLKAFNDKKPKVVIRHIFADQSLKCIAEDEDKKRYILEISDRIPLVGETWEVRYTYLRGDVPSMGELLERVE